MIKDESDAKPASGAFQTGNNAIITGAASGIGLAMARRFRAMGVNVCMLDADGERLRRVSEDLKQETGAAGLDESGAEVLALEVDVSKVDELEAARKAAWERWGKPPSVLVNNAATRIGGGVFSPLEDWRFTFEVNLWGVVNGVGVFGPGMIEAGAPGLIINVGSKQGITNPPGNTAYNMTKAAVRTYTEALEHSLRSKPDRSVSAHLLVPGWTTTGDREHKTGAWLPDQVVDYMFDALDRGSFYIVCPDDDVSEEMDHARILWTAGDITEDRPPLSRWVEDYKQLFENSSPGARNRGG